jgi:hypothetical protein
MEFGSYKMIVLGFIVTQQPAFQPEYSGLINF